MHVVELLLRGAGGEPVDFARTIVSHGVTELPPNRVELAARTLETTLPVPRGARTVRITASARRLHVEAVAGTEDVVKTNRTPVRTRATRSSARQEARHVYRSTPAESCRPLL
jgi:hypothetical protein